MDERALSAIILPAYRPDGRLLDVIRALAETEIAAIVLVDDGSGPEYAAVFARAAEFPRVHMIRHAVHLGDSAALKTGINHALCEFPNLLGVVTADAEKHHPGDIVRVARALADQPEHLVFGKAQPPLRGIPARLLPRLLRIEAHGPAFDRRVRMAAWEASLRVIEVPMHPMEQPRGRPPELTSVSLIGALAALAIACYFLWLSGAGFATGFSHDDLMNMWRSWREPLPRLLLDNLCFFAFPDSYRPLGGLFYHTFYNLFGLHPLPFRICLLAFLLANIYLTYSLTRRLSGSGELGAMTALFACYHWGLTPLYRNTGNCYEIFCFFFYLCGLLYYIGIRQQNRFLRPMEQVRFLTLLVCALNAKEMAISLPIMIGVYELLYHPPGWNYRRVVLWLFREARVMWVGLLLDLPFLIVKVYGPQGIGRITGRGPIRLSTYLHSLQHHLEGIFFAYGSNLFLARNLVILLLLLFLIAWRLRLPHFTFALLFWLIGILPTAFGPPPGIYLLYIPLVGLSICAATLLLQLRRLIWRRARQPQVVTFALLIVTLAAFYVNKGAHRATLMDVQSARIGSVIRQLRTQLPTSKAGAHMLFLKDPFEDLPSGKWASVFITHLLYHDSTLSVDRLSMLANPPDAARMSQYDYIFTMGQDKLVMVAPKVGGIAPAPPWTAKPLIQIVFGAGLTVATALALGFILIHALRLRLYRGERAVLAFICGSALLSNVIFLITAAGWARLAAFYAISSLAFAGLILVRRSTIRNAGESACATIAGQQFAPLPRAWKLLSLGVVTAFSWYYLSNAIAPEVSPDGVSYHLAFVSQYARTHGFPHTITSFYASLSQGMEMLFLFAFSIGKHSAAALVHCAFLYLLPLAMVRYAQRYGMAIAGVCGALLTFAAPVVGSDGVIAYNDVAAAFVVFVTFYLLQIWTEERDTRLVALAGLCAGFAYAVKYSVGLAVLYGLIVICYRMGTRNKRDLARSCAVFLLFASVSIAPWMIRDWLYIGNPVSPFFNRMFPNPFVTVEFEDVYRRVLAHPNGLKLWEIPWDTTVNGVRSCGLIGWVFLLAPLALLSLRKKQGRQLVCAAILFGLPVIANKGSRFLIPALPFLSLAMGMALARLPWLAGAVVVVHAVTSWPAVAGLYVHPYAWRLTEAPWAAALRLIPEEQYIAAHVSEYPATKMVEQHVPPDARTFAFEHIANAYSTRDVMDGFGTGEGIRLRDTLWNASREDYQPFLRFTFSFRAQPLYGIRLVPTGAGTGFWKIAELTIAHAGSEAPISPSWQIAAKPFPWDAGLAFDRSLITYWREDRPLSLGQFYQVRFGARPQVIDSVLLDCPRDQVPVKLEGEVEPGRWQYLAGPGVPSSPLPVVDLRRAATAEVRRSGFTYILTSPGGFIADDAAKDPAAWGLVRVGDAAGWRLYKIQREP